MGMVAVEGGDVAVRPIIVFGMKTEKDDRAGAMHGMTHAQFWTKLVSLGYCSTVEPRFTGAFSAPSTEAHGDVRQPCEPASWHLRLNFPSTSPPSGTRSATWNLHSRGHQWIWVPSIRRIQLTPESAQHLRCREQAGRKITTSHQLTAEFPSLWSNGYPATMCLLASLLIRLILFSRFLSLLR